MEDIVKVKLHQMEVQGLAVIMSDAQLDQLTDYDVKSLFNANQIGILDRYVCWIGEKPDNMETVHMQNTARIIY